MRASRALFLGYSQDEMIDKWQLRHDENCLYFTYIGQDYALNRTTAVISCLGSGTFPADPSAYEAQKRPGEPDMAADEIGPVWNMPDVSASFGVSMSMFDVLSRSGPVPEFAGEWKSISALAGAIGAGHEAVLGNRDKAAKLSGHRKQMDEACRRIGGTQMNVGDASWVLPVIELPALTEPISVWVQFWEADEEFPASLKILWDAAILQFMHYETLWYVMDDVIDYLMQSVLQS